MAIFEIIQEQKELESYTERKIVSIGTFGVS
jgi:hypothetical protein